MSNSRTYQPALRLTLSLLLSSCAFSSTSLAGDIFIDGNDAESIFLSQSTIGYDVFAGDLLVTDPLDPTNYPANFADDVRRPGFNGVDWSSRPLTNANGPYARNSGAESFGAFGSERARALVRVGPYVVAIDPWSPIDQSGPRATRDVRRRLEDGRQAWLREYGFVGQVRTFTNDGPAYARARSVHSRASVPLATFAGVSTPASRAAAAAVTLDLPKAQYATLKAPAIPASNQVSKQQITISNATIQPTPPRAATIHAPASPTRIRLPHAAGLSLTPAKSNSQLITPVTPITPNAPITPTTSSTPTQTSSNTTPFTPIPNTLPAATTPAKAP